MENIRKFMSELSEDDDQRFHFAITSFGYMSMDDILELPIVKKMTVKETIEFFILARETMKLVEKEIVENIVNDSKCLVRNL